MKTTKIFFAASISAMVLISCGTVTSYIGDTLTPSEKIDVYYAARDIKREYKVIGHISATTSINENAAKDKIVEKAKTVGADGVIILGLDFTGGKDSTPFEKADAIKYTN